MCELPQNPDSRTKVWHRGMHMIFFLYKKEQNNNNNSSIIDCYCK